jgi:integrase
MSEELFKHVSTVWVDGNGNRVQAGTPGATAVKIESKKWYARVKQGGRWKKVPLARDKRAALKMLADMTTRLERGAVGLVDPFEVTKKTPLAELLTAYQTDLKERGRGTDYIHKTGQQIETLVRDLKAETINDLHADAVDKFLTRLTCSARTKNTYRGAVFGLLNWLVKKDRLDHNPLRRVSKRVGELKRRRRAETPENLQKILTAATSRGVHEAGIIRRGPRRGQSGATIKPHIKERLERIGRGRALVYLFSIHTGLRASSIRKTRVCDLHLDGLECFISLPPTAMKNKRAFLQRLRPDLVTELKAWITDTSRSGTDKVFDLPTPPQISKTLRKDLAFAGVPYRDDKGRVFDFHSFRKCKGSFLRLAKVDPSVSMAQLGHADIRMTMQVYNDENLLPHDEALAATPNLTIR